VHPFLTESALRVRNQYGAMKGCLLLSLAEWERLNNLYQRSGRIVDLKLSVIAAGSGDSSEESRRQAILASWNFWWQRRVLIFVAAHTNRHTRRKQNRRGRVEACT